VVDGVNKSLMFRQKQLIEIEKFNHGGHEEKALKAQRN